MRPIILLLSVIITLHGQQNHSQVLLGMVDQPLTPTDSPGGGTYSSTQSVTLSDPTSALILYTTNGSTPACPATGTLYSGAISVSVTTTIKAIGCNGVTGGGVLTSVYTIGTPISIDTTAGHFCATDDGVASGTTQSCTLTYAAGQIVYASAIVSTNCGSITASLSDGTNSYTNIATGSTAAAVGTGDIPSGQCGWQWYYINSAGTGSKNLTVTWSTSVTYKGVAALQMINATALDTGTTPFSSGFSSTASNTATVSPALSPSGSASAIIAAPTSSHFGLTFTAGSGYTLISTGSSNNRIALEYQVGTLSGLSPTFTLSGSSWFANIFAAAFK